MGALRLLLFGGGCLHDVAPEKLEPAAEADDRAPRSRHLAGWHMWQRCLRWRWQASARRPHGGCPPDFEDSNEDGPNSRDKCPIRNPTDAI